MWMDTLVTQMLSDILKMGDWVDDAECRGQPLEWWFPLEFNKQSSNIKTAKMICGRCKVRDQCLEYAMSYPQGYLILPGIWGGLTESQRRQLHSDRYWAQVDAQKDP